MICGHDVSFEYEYESEKVDDDGDPLYLLLDVSASITDYYPSVMYLSNGDPGYPAEGGEVEDLEVIGPDGLTWQEIPPALQVKLEYMARDRSNF